MALGGAVILAVALVGCSGNGSSPTDPADRARGEIRGEWVLVHGESPSGEFTALPRYPVTLESDAHGNPGVVGGHTSCNDYGFHPRYDGGGLAADGIDSTGALCPGARDDLEKAYYGALEIVDSVETNGDSLVLTGPETTVTFVRQESATAE
jgi:heat shock protein HslJ